MSASREKKQRQSAGPSEKAIRAKQEQAALKRKTVTYSVVGAVIAVLVIALLVWRTGFFQSRTIAATVGDDTITAAEMGFYYGRVRSYYASWGSYLGFDTSKADDDQFYNAADNITYRDYFMDEALKSAQQELVLSKQAISDGHTEADVKDSLAEEINSAKSAATANGLSYAAYLRAVYGSYMTPALFETMTTRYLLSSLASYEKGHAFYNSYSQSDLDDYYKENADTLDTIEYSYLRFNIPTVSTTDDDGNELPEDEVQKLEDEARDGAKKDAEAALKAVESGSTFTSQAEKYELTSSGDHSKVVGTSSVSSTVTSTVSEQLLELDKNECLLVETDSSFYVVSLHDRYLEDEPTRDVRHILARAEDTTDDDGNVAAPTDEAWAAAKAKIDEIQAAWDASDKTEDAFAALANEKSDDGNGTGGGLIERNADGTFVTEFNDWVFDSSRQPGDVGMVRHEAEDGDDNVYYGYHLIYYVGENEPVWMGSARNALALTARDEWIEELNSAAPAALADGAKYLGK